MGEQDKETALFAECKWRNEKVDTAVLDTLIERSKLFRYRKNCYFIFSKSGFTQGCISKAAEIGNVFLVPYSDMVD
ncbi:hypothetical protein J6Z39_01115 [bacterium]|nr:hypothetical protein [bacterium]MBP5434399.1 hypothetical protein [bacterium]